MLLEEIQSLYEQKKYSEVMDKCIKCIETDNPTADIFLFVAKSAINTFSYDHYEQFQNLLQSAISSMFSLAQKREDIVDWICELQDLAKRKEVAITKSYMDIFISNPANRAIYQKCIKVPLFLTIYLDLTANTSLCAYANEKFGEISNEEYVKMIQSSKYYTDYNKDYEINNIYYNTALQLFQNGKALHIRNAQNLPRNSYDNYTSTLLHHFIYAQLLLSNVSNSKDTTLKLQSLLMKAECMEYKLNATFNSENVLYYLYTGNRAKEISELSKTYHQILELDASFIMPELPPIEVSPVLPRTTTTSSDGCYVATAVYGSYNCPEVWTLRRFRDGILSKTWYGRAFIYTYYAISPTLIKLFGENLWFYNVCKPKLDKLVTKLNKQGVENSPYQDRNWRL